MNWIYGLQLQRITAAPIRDAENARTEKAMFSGFAIWCLEAPNGWVDGWLQSNGILATQVAAIYHT